MSGFPRIYPFRTPPPPYTPGENWLARDFNWNTPSPFNLYTIPINYRIITCQIRIHTPFNDAASKLKVGTLAIANRFMTEDENVPNEIGEYESNPYLLTSAATDIYITITPAAASQGFGTVLLEFDQPFP